MQRADRSNPFDLTPAFNHGDAVLWMIGASCRLWQSASLRPASLSNEKAHPVFSKISLLPLEANSHSVSQIKMHILISSYELYKE